MQGLAAEWRAGESLKERVLQQARRVSALTIPYIIPPDGSAKSEELVDPFQSQGARGVNVRASKMLQASFPQTPFFIYEANTEAFAATLEDGGEADAETRVKLKLAERERAIMRALNEIRFRPRALEAYRHVQIAGTSLLRLYKDLSPARSYNLNEFQIRRDTRGDWNRIITLEKVRPEDLPARHRPKVVAGPSDGRSDTVDLYTAIERFGHADDRGGYHWKQWQELGEQRVGRVLKFTDEADVLWLPFRLTTPAGHDYGRSPGEESLGDLRSLEGLSMALVEGAAIAAECKFLVSPGAGILPNEIQNASNGSYLSGRADLVKPIRVDKSADMSVAFTMRDDIKKELQKAFLDAGAVQRSGERVTAAEIGALIREIDTSDGGGFTILTDELLAPLAVKLDRLLVTRGDLNALPEGLAAPKVITGIDAIGRGAEVESLANFSNIGQRGLGAEQFAGAINRDEYLKRLALGLGIDPDNLIKTLEQLQTEQNDQAQRDAAVAAAPTIAQNAQPQ